MDSNRKLETARLVLKDLIEVLRPRLSWQQCQEGHGTGLIVELGDLGVGELVEYVSNGHGSFCSHGSALLDLTDGHYHDDRPSDTAYAGFEFELRRTGGRPLVQGAFPVRTPCLDRASTWVSADSKIEVKQVVLEVTFLRRSFDYSESGAKIVFMDCADVSMLCDVKGDARGLVPSEFIAWLLDAIT